MKVKSDHRSNFVSFVAFVSFVLFASFVSFISFVAFVSFCDDRYCDDHSSLSRLFFCSFTAAWLAQLVERQSVVREVEGSINRLDQHSGT